MGSVGDAVAGGAFEVCTRRDAAGTEDTPSMGSAGRSAAARASGWRHAAGALNMIEVAEQAGEDGCGSHRTPPVEGFPFPEGPLSGPAMDASKAGEAGGDGQY